jgi:carbonic anhydrase
MLDLWISHVKNVYDKYQDELDGIEDMQAKVDRLSELNVMEQVINLWKNPYIQKSWKKGNPVWVHGWIFRVLLIHIQLRSRQVALKKLLLKPKCHLSSRFTSLNSMT